MDRILEEDIANLRRKASPHFPLKSTHVYKNDFFGSGGGGGIGSGGGSSHDRYDPGHNDGGISTHVSATAQAR